MDNPRFGCDSVFFCIFVGASFFRGCSLCSRRCPFCQRVRTPTFSHRRSYRLWLKKFFGWRGDSKRVFRHQNSKSLPIPRSPAQNEVIVFDRRCGEVMLIFSRSRCTFSQVRLIGETNPENLEQTRYCLLYTSPSPRD